MLKLNLPETSELGRVMAVKAECVNCTVDELVEAQFFNDAANELNKKGWRSYETSNETAPLICPNCVDELTRIDEEENE